MDARAAAIATHEAAHAVAATLLGRQVMYVSRTGNLCGETFSKQQGSDLLSGLVTLIVPVYVSPIELPQHDLLVAENLHSIGADVTEAHRQARALVEEPRFRNGHRAVEWALWSRPFLTGMEVELILALDKENV